MCEEGEHSGRRSEQDVVRERKDVSDWKKRGNKKDIRDNSRERR